ncbi:MAG: protein-L-isoaspartate(D-aspartate) O-methyltransferase [Magnetospiraceae bacterium]
MNAAESSVRRRVLLAEIEAEIRQTARLTGCVTLSPAVREAMSAVPRHLFVGAHQQSIAYENRPLPIGRGQTISQPYIVALMTELLALDDSARVLEIGTGCGYQTAVLASVAGRVWTVERIAGLLQDAQDRFALLGLENVTCRHGDGFDGWPAEAPFDGIIVTAAPEFIPPALIDQLAPGGKMVLPVGAGNPGQSLRCLTKSLDGTIEIRDVLPVAFVPLRPGQTDAS